MKRTGLTLVAALAFSASVFAGGTQGNETKSAARWDASINKVKLSHYLQLTSDQHEEVENICDYFQGEMSRALRAKKNSDEKVRNAVYRNLKLMKQTLNEKQYADYVRLMAVTLRNKGIDVAQK